MDRRTFLIAAGAAAMAPAMPAASGVSETYSTCPAGFALRTWAADDGQVYRMVVPLPRYIEGSKCRWTEHAKRMEAKSDD